jgi:hypothetical protein
MLEYFYHVSVVHAFKLPRMENGSCLDSTSQSTCPIGSDSLVCQKANDMHGAQYAHHLIVLMLRSAAGRFCLSIVASRCAELPRVSSKDIL